VSRIDDMGLPQRAKKQVARVYLPPACSARKGRVTFLPDFTVRVKRVGSGCCGVRDTSDNGLDFRRCGAAVQNRGHVLATSGFQAILAAVRFCPLTLARRKVGIGSSGSPFG
jgi:hypothetical protein